MSLYDTLGVAKNASTSDIKRAFKRRAAKTHPDKGGSAEAFHAVRLAHDVLTDETRRAQYDETGETNVVDQRKRARDVLMTSFAGLLDSVEWAPHVDYVGTLRKHFKGEVEKVKNRKAGLLRKIERANDIVLRRRDPSDPDDPLTGLLTARVVEMRTLVAKVDLDLDMLGHVLTLLDDYEATPQGPAFTDPMSRYTATNSTWW